MGPTEHVGLGLRDREARQKQEASDFTGINHCRQVSGPSGSISSVQQPHMCARPGQSSQRLEQCCAPGAKTLETEHKDFSSQLTSGRLGRSHPAHFICSFLHLLCLTFYFPLTSVILTSFPIFVYFHVTNRNSWLGKTSASSVIMPAFSIPPVAATI